MLYDSNLRPLRAEGPLLQARVDAPQVIRFIVTHEEILSEDTHSAEESVRHQLHALLEFGRRINAVPEHERGARAMAELNTMLGISNIEFSIDGYNSDSRELEEIPEVVAWAGAWVRRQVYAPLFLNSSGQTLLMLLLLGSIRRGSIRLPNVNSERLCKWQEILAEGKKQLVSAHGDLYPIVPFVLKSCAIAEMHLNRIRKTLRPWWKLW
jgi:hypothetical protein